MLGIALLLLRILGDPKANEAAKFFKHVPENCRLSGLLENEYMGIKDQGSEIGKK